MQHYPRLRQQLARRIRAGVPAEWHHFARLWLAFNAIYGGEADKTERRRIKSSIRSSMSAAKARAVINKTDAAVSRMLNMPPGDMRLEKADPGFRRASREQTRIYRTSPDAVEKVAALAAILYQVRCNLLHGSKDPDNPRDNMLVRESVRILEALLTAIGV